jgi:hypothetical protein
MAIKRESKIKLFIVAVASIVFLLLLGQPAFCAWTAGPIEVLSGNWGSEIGQFGLVIGDTGEGLPTELAIDKDLMLIIADEMNKRVQIFKPDGSLYKVINKPPDVKVTMWPGSLIVPYEGNSFLANLYIYNYFGEILCKIDIPRTERYGVTGGYIIKNLDNNLYYRYSRTGQLLNTYTERPLELGEVKEKYLGPGKYKYTVKYPDTTWEIIREGAFSSQSYIRDMTGNLYAIGSNYVVRYDGQGNELAKLTMPEARFQGVELPSNLPSDAELPRPEVSEGYGPPVLAPNGDVYTSKRTPDKYYIIKWLWQ